MKNIIIYNKGNGNVESIISTTLLYDDGGIERVLETLSPLLNDSQGAVYSEFESMPSKISVDDGEVTILEEKGDN